MRFTLRQLEVFLATARHENITRAADSLAMSQSAASGALRDMAEHASRAAGQMAQSVQAGAEAMAPPAEATASAATAKQRRRAGADTTNPVGATPAASGAGPNTPASTPRAGARRRRQP